MNNNNYIIMPLNRNDVHEIFRLNNIWNTTFWTINNIYEEINKEGNLNFKLFYNNKNTLGYIFSTITIDELNILNICIHPDFRNKGFGYILLKYVIDRGFILGATSVFLEVRSSNKAALHLYEKCCFEKSFIRKKYYLDGEDAVLMSLKKK